jgi:hypothetical protein
VGLAQLIRFLVMKLTHSDLNLRFDMSVTFTVIILSVGGSVSVDSETLLVTDFVSLKIKLTQSFRCAHKNRVCARIFIELSIHMFMSICVYTVLKKSHPNNSFISFDTLLGPTH